MSRLIVWAYIGARFHRRTAATPQMLQPMEADVVANSVSVH